MIYLSTLEELWIKVIPDAIAYITSHFVFIIIIVPKKKKMKKRSYDNLLQNSSSDYKIHILFQHNNLL